MNWRNLPDAPERVKYHGGYDPSDPPTDQESETMMCDCGHQDFEEEVTYIGDKTYCVNCVDEFGKLNTDATGQFTQGD